MRRVPHTSACTGPVQRFHRNRYIPCSATLQLMDYETTAVLPCGSSSRSSSFYSSSIGSIYEACLLLEPTSTEKRRLLASRKRQYTYLLVPSGASLMSRISSSRPRPGKWVFTVESKESQQAILQGLSILERRGGEKRKQKVFFSRNFLAGKLLL